MSTDDVKRYFERMNVQKVTWINDSSCTIQFDSPETATKAYEVFALSENKDRANIDIGMEVSDERNFDSKIGWKDALSYSLPQ